ncbi:MAG: type IV pilus modification PilV family protein [Thermoleophilia bacterium]
MKRTDLGHRRDGQPGFTLIEIMVATLLLLLVLAGFVPFFLSGLEKSSAARYQSAATNIAREMMEEIRQLDYREIQEDTAQPTNPANLSNRLDTTKTVRGSTFDIVYAVENSTSGGGQLKKVTVTVSWTGTPAGDPAVVTSLIHQQFLGPRGSLLELGPETNVTSDPLGTPFPLISDTLWVKYYIAPADWGLVYENLNLPGMAARNVYLRMALVNDAGLTLPLGSSASDYKIDASALNYSTGTDGKVDKVWFQYAAFDTLSFPDGYWEIQASAYNEYDQPGNVWRLRVRIDNTAPNPPASVLAVAGVDNQSIHVSWVPGDEGDRDHWVLERRTRATDGTWPDSWNTLTTLPGAASQYDDIGEAATAQDPWGSFDPSVTNFYEYRLWAIDWAGNVGTAATAQEQVPAADASTTTTVFGTTTTTAGTTTTTGVSYYSVTIRDNTPKEYDITVNDSANNVIFTGRVGKNGATLQVTGLPSGSYQIQAVEVTNNSPRVIPQAFSVPPQAGQIVLDIY